MVLDINPLCTYSLLLFSSTTSTLIFADCIGILTIVIISISNLHSTVRVLHGSELKDNFESCVEYFVKTFAFFGWALNVSLETSISGFFLSLLCSHTVGHHFVHLLLVALRTLSGLSLHKFLIEHFSKSGNINSGSWLMANILDVMFTSFSPFSWRKDCV